MFIALLYWSPLGLVLQAKVEPSAHDAIFGLNSLLRLKVFCSPPALCSFLVLALLLWSRFSSRNHSKVSLSRKEPLNVQMSLTVEIPTSPSQTEYKVMFAETIRGTEKEQILVWLYMHNYKFYVLTQQEKKLMSSQLYIPSDFGKWGTVSVLSVVCLSLG